MKSLKLKKLSNKEKEVFKQLWAELLRGKIDRPIISPLYEFSLRDLQEKLPWTLHYNRNFRKSKIKHKDFQHALIHVMKAVGKLSSVINDAEHAGHDFNGLSVNPYVADLVICALRMANTSPAGKFDLHDVVINRIERKNDVVLEK